MKQFLVIFFATMMLVLTTRNILTIASFKINQNFIANNFCVNKDKPAMCCKGKCYLTKKVIEQDTTQEDSPNMVYEQVMYYTQLSFKIPPPMILVGSLLSPYYLVPKQEIPSDIFHPPQQV